MSAPARFRSIQELGLESLDSAQFLARYRPLLNISKEKKDRRSAWLLRFGYFLQRRRLHLAEDETIRLLEELEQTASDYGLEIELAVANHYLFFERYTAQRLPHEKAYVAIIREFERMGQLGFEKFGGYNIAGMLFHDGSFMYELDDLDKSLQYLTVAERFNDPEATGLLKHILILNFIQSIHQKRGEVPKAIEYAKKIIEFTETYPAKNQSDRDNCRTWQGIASIDIGSMLVAQGKLTEGERFASDGYELARVGDVSSSHFLQARYDALQVLISIKLELGKLDEAAALLRRVDEINAVLDKLDPPSYFKHIRFYQSYARLFEKKGEFAAAFRYSSRAKTLQDSLDRRNDARKFEKIQQRLDAEKYTEKLSLVESEKRLQTWLRNAAILIMLLVAGLAFFNFKRLQNRRRQAEKELEAAQKQLIDFTDGLREKSELAENLRLEIDKIARSGERSEYLEKLTRSTILTEEDWSQFRGIFEKAHPQFISEKKAQHPDLTPAELRLLVLEKLDLTAQEMANMLGISKNTIHQTRYRLKKKMGDEV